MLMRTSVRCVTSVTMKADTIYVVMNLHYHDDVTQVGVMCIKVNMIFVIL